MKKAMVLVFTSCLLISLVFFVRSTDWNTVVSLIQTTGYGFSLLLLSTFIAYFFGTVSWQCALGEYAKCISTSRLFLIRHVGETAGLFNPASAIGGDALKAMILRSYQIPNKTVVWSMLFSRGIMVLSQLLLFAGTALALALHDPLFWAKGLHISKRAGLPPLLLAGWKSFWQKFSDVLQELPMRLKENRQMLLLSCLFALLHWVFGGLEFYLILKFLGLKVTVGQALMADLGVVVFKAAGAFVPGQIGVEEYGNKIMLMLIGMPDEEIWVAVSVLRRARQLFWIAVAVLIYFFMFKKWSPGLRN